MQLRMAMQETQYGGASTSDEKSGLHSRGSEKPRKDAKEEWGT